MTFFSKNRAYGFTLAELLSALAILGVIATFTIPKVINATQSGQSKAMGKEVAATLAGAMSAYSLNNTPSASTSFSDLTPYLNYVSTDTSTLIDALPGGGSNSCSLANSPCLKLHNGGIIRYHATQTFGGTDSLRAFWVHFDPDGTYGGSTSGSSKSLGLFIYINGRITSEGYILTGTQNSGGAFTANLSKEPDWWSW